MGALKSNVTLQMGLISVPVNVETAIEGKQEVSLNTLCLGGPDDTGTVVEHPPSRVKQDLKCPTCTNADKATFVKGKDNKDGTFTLVDASEIEAAGPDASVKTGLSLTVHPASDLTEALPGGKVYYLSPGKSAGKNYALLANVVKEKADYAFLCEFAVRSVSALYRLGLAGDVLTITELAWPESIKARPSVSPEYDENMLPLALNFADTLVTPFDVNQYRDKRTEMLSEILAKSEAVQGTESDEPGTGKAPSTPKLDLAAQLQAAVDAAKGPATKKAARKAPAKKAVAVA